MTRKQGLVAAWNAAQNCVNEDSGVPWRLAVGVAVRVGGGVMDVVDERVESTVAVSLECVDVFVKDTVRVRRLRLDV